MDQYTLFVLLSPFGCIIETAVAVYCWRHRYTFAARSLAYATGAVSAYLFFNTLELVDPTPQGTLFFAQVAYICLSLLTVNWLAFALAYSNHENLLRSQAFRLLWIIPAITVALVFTNSYHHLVWKDYTFIPVTNGYLYMRVLSYGIWFWVFWLQAYMLITTATILMVRTSFSGRMQFRMQSRLAVAAALLPLIVNLIYVLHLIPGLLKDYSPLSYAFSGILLAISIFRYRMLDLAPLARGVLIDNMNDGMLTLDPKKQVVDFNPAAQRIFEESNIPALKMDNPFPFFEAYIRPFDSNSTVDLLQTEINLPQKGEEVYFDMQIRRLRDQQSAGVVGYLVLLHTITEHKRLLQAVRKLAEEDMLTGVLNRSRFVELARTELSHVRASPQFFTIMMIDIDNFKRINDSLGHVAGDQILQAFTRRLRVLLRNTDLIGRLGGDEFIVMLPDTTLDNGLQLAERLCQQVAARPMETNGYGELTVTISVGVAETTETSSETLEPVIIMADKGLYQAKALGRNRACVFDPNLETQTA